MFHLSVGKKDIQCLRRPIGLFRRSLRHRQSEGHLWLCSDRREGLQLCVYHNKAQNVQKISALLSYYQKDLIFSDEPAMIRREGAETKVGGSPLMTIGFRATSLELEMLKGEEEEGSRSFWG